MSIRTLVGLKIIEGGTPTMISIQNSSLSNNNEWLELKATSSIGNDLIALKRRMPELTCETHDLKTLWTALGNNIYKAFTGTGDIVNLYQGTFASTPQNGYFFVATGVLKQIATNPIVYIDRISCDIGEPLSVSFKIRGSPVTTGSEDLASFSLSHAQVNTIAGLTYNTTTIGIRNFELNTNIEFYDHYETDIDPELSAITNVNPQARATILIDDYTAIEALEEETDFVVNLNKYQGGGLPQVPAGNITLNDCVVKIETTDAAIGRPSTAEIILKPKTITIGLT